MKVCAIKLILLALSSSPAAVVAFVHPSSCTTSSFTSTSSTNSGSFHRGAIHSSGSTSIRRNNSNINKLHALPLSNLPSLPSLPSLAISVDTSSLTQYFLETLISYGVPAFFWIVIIAFAAKAFKGSKKDAQMSGRGPNGNLFGTSRTNVINELYSDLYDGTADDDDRNKSPFAAALGRGGGSAGSNKIPKNLGIPKDQFLKITKLNDKYASYQYTLTAATQSKAKAAAQYRSHSFDTALQRAFDSSISELNNAQKSDLLLEEKEFLNKGGEILSGITSLQTALTSLVINEEMENMDVEIGEVDTHDSNVIDATIIKDDDENNNNTSDASTSTTNSTATESGKKDEKKKKKGVNKKEINKLVKEIERQNTELLKLEMEFIRAVVEIMGPVSKSL